MVADVLSRINLDDQTFEGEKESLVKIYNIFKTRADLQALLINIRIHQQSDQKLKNIMSRLESNDETVSKYYHLNKGILFIKTALDEKTWKVIIPHQIEKEVIIDYHVRYGHMGALKVIQALEENCKIKNINRKVRTYIKSCNICQCVKINNEKKEGIMIPITSNAKLEKVFLDICCLLYTSRCV